MTLGQRIQELRKALGLSQEGLGEKLNVSRQAISKWEADGAVPEVDKLIALSRLFRISLNDLLQVDCPASTPEDSEAAAEELDALIQKARRKRRFSRLAGALCAISFVLGIAALMLLVVRQSAQLGKARDDLTAQELRISRLEAQAAALAEAAARPGLDPAAPLVADFSLGLESSMHSGPSVSGVRVNVSLLPAQSVADMAAAFQVTGPGLEAFTQNAQRQPGATEYQAELLLPDGGGGVTISVVFDDGSAQYTCPLVSDLYVSDTGSSYTPLWSK